MREVMDFPCLICGRTLVRAFADCEAQPSGGLNCSTQGHYGSAVFDPGTGESITFNICDPCVTERAEKGLVFACFDGRDDKVYVPWIPDSDEEACGE